MTRTKTEAWTLIRQRHNYILSEDNKEQMEAWTLLYIAEDNKDADGSVDSVRWREPIICTLT